MIISASRRTDIPAHYSDWFVNRLNEGFLYVRNPFNANQVSKITLNPIDVECIVFWTKNPKKLIDKLSEIDRLGYKYYFQFTVTSYDSSIEINIPKKAVIIETFRILSEIVGSERVIWRYDPIFLSDKFNIDYHLRWYEYLSNQLNGFTKKCIISFIDMYKKCERNLKNIKLLQVDETSKNILAKNLSSIAKSNNIIIETCAQTENFESFGIHHGKCVDDNLISSMHNAEISVNKDKNQRLECGCVASIDVGTYNTCKHGCRYCYANYSDKSVENNILNHNIKSPLLVGELTGKEKIIERKVVKHLSRQLSIFK